MCTGASDTTGLSRVEQDYVDSFARVLLADTEARAAEDRWIEQSDRISEELDDNSFVERGPELVELAIKQSGLPEDDKSVQRARKATALAFKVMEATANGLDPETARLATAFGIDPRTLGGEVGA